MKSNFKSAVHMLITKDNKILVQKRKNTKLWPDYYALPVGHIDEYENQYDALIREAKEELNIIVKKEDIIKEYVVLRRNHFVIDDKILEPYIDSYFDIESYEGIPIINEPNKCSELLWSDINNLPYPFINYEGYFLENMNIKTYDCLEANAYVKKYKRW